jgi:cephalosporin hydroxylase
MYEWRPDIACPWDLTFKKHKDWYPEYYKIKHDICKRLNPKVIVEIGVRAGYSADAFLQACPEAKYIGYDADNFKHGGKRRRQHPPYMEWAEDHLIDNGYDAIINFPVDTQEIDEVASADFYHIDGDHTTKGVMHDLDICYNSAPVNAYLLVDDIDSIPGVKAGVDQWIEEHRDSVTDEYIKSYRGELLIQKVK